MFRIFSNYFVIMFYYSFIICRYGEFTFNDNYGLANEDILCYGEQYRSLAMLINHSSTKNNVEVRVVQYSIIPRLEVVALHNIHSLSLSSPSPSLFSPLFESFDNRRY